MTHQIHQRLRRVVLGSDHAIECALSRRQPIRRRTRLDAAARRFAELERGDRALP